MFHLVYIVVVGLMVGWISRKVYSFWNSANDVPIGVLPTLITGIIGSFVGGGINFLIFGTYTAGLLMSVVGGVIFCYGYSRYHLKNYVPLDKLSD